MSDMKIPPRGVNDLSSPNFQTPPTSTEKTGSPANISSLEKALPAHQQQVSSSQIEIPYLQPPSQESSLADFLSILGNAVLYLKEAKKMGSLVDSYARMEYLEIAASQASYMAELNVSREEMLQQIETMTEESVHELQTIFDEISTLNTEQQQAINAINAGNSEEAKAFRELVNAYNTYISNLESIGAVKQPDGTYYIPSDKIDEYNAYTAEYQEAVNEFNTYWTNRLADINTYNQAVEEYNKKAAELNSELAAFFTENNISPVVTLPYIEPRDTEGYNETIEAPELLPVPPETTENDPGSPPPSPVSVSVPTLPSFVQDIASNGVPEINSITPYPYTNADDFYESIYVNLYQIHVGPIDAEIATSVQYWSYMNEAASSSRREDSNQIFMNDKPLVDKLLSFLETKKQTQEISNASLTTRNRMESISNKMIDEHSKIILGKEIFQEILKSEALKLNEVQINQMVERLMLLSLGLINHNSLNTLIPIFESLTPVLNLLPADSPAFGLLFASTLIDRFQEGMKNGLNKIAIEKMFENFDTYETLPQKVKNQLEATVNLTLLLISTKLLENNLGLPGLISELIQPLKSEFPHAPFEKDFSSQVLKNYNTQIQQLNQHFVNKGFSAEEAAFLSELSVKLIREGIQAPSATLITPQTINRPLLVDSLKAALILSKDRVPFTQAEAIAHQAINDTFVENLKLSKNQFLESLEYNLKNLGIQKNLANILASVVILPANETFSNSPRNNNSTTDIKDVIQKRILQLLIPQTGTAVAEEVAEKVTRMLTIKNEEQAPLSWWNVTREEIKKVNKEQDEELSLKIAENFRMTVETSLDLSKFLMKLMDPAYLFLLATYLGDLPTTNRIRNNLIT